MERGRIQLCRDRPLSVYEMTASCITTVYSTTMIDLLSAINARAMSNEEGASIGYVGCHIAHVLEMRRGKIIVASSPPHKMHALLARTTA